MSLVKHGFSRGKTMTATNQFRWKVDSLNHASQCATITVWGRQVSTMPPGVLEQRWQGSDGSIEWIPVPIVGPDDD